jgi:hypothetical protein
MIHSIFSGKYSVAGAGLAEFSKRFWRRLRHRSRRAAAGSDLRYDMQIILEEEAASGVEKEIEVRKLIRAASARVRAQILIRARLIVLPAAAAARSKLARILSGFPNVSAVGGRPDHREALSAFVMAKDVLRTRAASN